MLTMIKTVPALLLLTLALGGCTFAPGTPDLDPIPNAAYPQIVTTGYLHNRFFFVPPVVSPEANGRPMSVTVAVRLKAGHTAPAIPCQYRFIFLDARGVPLDVDPIWRWRKVEPRVQTILQGSAPDFGAVDWRCEIRPDKVTR